MGRLTDGSFEVVCGVVGGFVCEWELSQDD